MMRSSFTITPHSFTIVVDPTTSIQFHSFYKNTFTRNINSLTIRKQVQTNCIYTLSKLFVQKKLFLLKSLLHSLGQTTRYNTNNHTAQTGRKQILKTIHRK